jgi:microsomal dipeptidase-like Zn-dependent dipeptidase
LFFKENIDGVTNPDAIKDAYSRIFLDNAFQIVKAVGNASGWNCICLGSDYDGAISHVDLYDKCSTMPEMYQNLVEYLSRTRYQQQLWYGYKPEEMIRKIMIDNVMEFYSRHFV